ncbi:hypothetical protein BGZ96_003509 [Linnemannia gamsii]|uniref:HCP-like protein n=1 Tax=Linnemannia gamsii TaxID=64522 RepID=A0ABQ7K9E3_9FUNG|nr:hypothetical protein BGZ96_003509 [Linnemannia gamsii]
MSVQDTLPNVQAVRRVLENDTPTDEPTLASSRIFHLPCHPDTSSGKDILLWDDILAAFKDDVVHIRSGTIILPFLKGPDFKNLNPLRIAMVPGITLDVVVRNRLGGAKPDTPHQGNTTSSVLVSDTTTLTAASVRRNPVGGLVEEAMQNYNHIDKPATLPPRRGPQAIFDEQANPKYNDDADIPRLPTTITSSYSRNSNNSDSRLRAPQGLSSASTSDFEETKLKARLGDKVAQFAVGESYRTGRGAQQDYQAAMDWYLKSAEQGYAGAQYGIGYLYDYGHGVSEDFSKAMEWYQKAAEQGHPAAQTNIGQLYQNGQSVPKDYSQAMKWYQKSAGQGDAAAQSNIGQLYHDGHGVPKDYSQAMEWYQKAAEQGHPTAQYHIGYLYDNGNSVSQDFSKAMEWYQKAAEQGHPAAQSNIGSLYYNGQGVPKEYSQAMAWYQKAAEQGHATAQTNIGVLHQTGQGVPKDYSQAMEWYQKAAEQGHASAQFNIGWLYEHGVGVPKDRATAMEWYKKAADGGNVEAKEQLGKLERQGHNTHGGDGQRIRSLLNKIFN